MAAFSDVLLTVDFDRTLTAPDSTIPQRNVEAISYFIANGGSFTVNTGRSLPMTQVFRDVVPVNAPLLLYNGSAAYDLSRKEFTFLHRIPLDQEETIRKLQAAFPGLALEMQGLDAHYAFAEDPAWDAFCQNNHCAMGHANPGDDLGPFLKLSLYAPISIDNPTVASLFDATPERLAWFDGVEAQLRQILGDACEVFRAAPLILDIHAKGVSKIRSARQLQQQLGKKILICVGDGENDLPMLEGADYAFTPADAIVAGRFPNVCPCADGAVADVIYKKIPEILRNMP